LLFALAFACLLFACIKVVTGTGTFSVATVVPSVEKKEVKTQSKVLMIIFLNISIILY
jgi:hypothetical protein